VQNHAAIWSFEPGTRGFFEPARAASKGPVVSKIPPRYVVTRQRCVFRLRVPYSTPRPDTQCYRLVSLPKESNFTEHRDFTEDIHSSSVLRYLSPTEINHTTSPSNWLNAARVTTSIELLMSVNPTPASCFEWGVPFVHRNDTGIHHLMVVYIC